MSGEPNRGKSAGRPLQMLAVLMNGEPLDANTAAKRFGVQRAMALRDLQALEKCLPGVVCDSRRKPHVFRFESKTHSQTGTQLKEGTTPPMAIAASLGAAFSSVFAGTRYQTDLENLRRNIVQRLKRRRGDFGSGNRKFFVVCGREEVLDEQAALLDDVVEAVLSQRAANIYYGRFDGSEEHLKIYPYSLVVYDSHLYVVGVDVSKGVPKAAHPYRFARIRSFDVLKENFAYPEPSEYDPDVLFRDSIGVWLGDPAPCRVRVRLTAYWAVYAKHHRWHQSQQLSKQSDGSVELQLMVRPCAELEQWVLRFGDNAEVIEPTDFREKIAARLKAASLLYSGSNRVRPGRVKRRSK